MAKVNHHLALNKATTGNEWYVVPGEPLEDYKARLLELKGIDIDSYNFERFFLAYNEFKNRRTPTMHREWCQWIDSTDDKARRQLQAYRHSGKSELIAVLGTYYLFKSPSASVMIVSAGQTIATNRAKFIKNLIEAWPLVNHLYPGKKGDNWQKASFSVLSPGIEVHDSMQCSSLSSDWTGFHASGDGILIADDLETSSNASNQDGLRDRVTELASIAPRHLYIGTPHAEDTLYNHLKDVRPDTEQAFWPVWFNERERITQLDRDKDPVTGEPLLMAGINQDADWAEMQRQEQGSDKFKSQYLLIPANAGESRFNPHLVKEFTCELEIKQTPGIEGTSLRKRFEYHIDGRRLTQMVAYFDPSSAASKNHDESVLNITGFAAEDQSVWVFESEAMPPINERTQETYDSHCDRIIDLLAHYHMDRINVETNFNPLIANSLREAAIRKGRKLTVIQSTRTKAVTGGRGKNAFIADYVELLLNKQKLNISQRVFRKPHGLGTQIVQFPNGKTDDHLDAFASACHELQIRTILTQAKPDPVALFHHHQPMKFEKYKPFAKRESR